MGYLRESIDHVGHRVAFSFPPQRIVSLVPSQTELLFDLGLGDRVVGRTKFCIHPQHLVKEAQVVGGTKNFRPDLIKKLKPDLVIGNREENVKESIEALREELPVWTSDVSEVKDAVSLVRTFGELTGAIDTANDLSKRLSESLESTTKTFSGKVLYLIWKDPWMAAGRQTFIHSMLEWLGFTNSVKNSRYPQYRTSELAALTPDYIFLSSEPYPFKARHVEEVCKIFPSGKVCLVNGEMFSWYGSRLIQSPDYFQYLNSALSG